MNVSRVPAPHSRRIRPRRGPAIAALTATAPPVAAAVGPAVADTVTADGAKPTAVLAQGAFADAFGWNGAIGRLQRDGYAVVAPADPLRGPAGNLVVTSRKRGAL
jgi:hypothetical protein